MGPGSIFLPLEPNPLEFYPLEVQNQILPAIEHQEAKQNQKYKRHPSQNCQKKHGVVSAYVLGHSGTWKRKDSFNVFLGEASMATGQVKCSPPALCYV